MSAIIEGKGRTLPPIPSQLMEYVAWDRSAKVVYVAKTHTGAPLLHTWTDRLRHMGVDVRVEPRELDDIAKLRSEGFGVSANTNDGDLKTRERALELLRKSAAYRASDMHLLIRDGFSEVQIRVKGELKVLEQFRADEGEGIARAIYQGIATVKDSSYNPLEIQNGQISSDALNGMALTSVRIVRGPSYPKGGGFAVLRLQYREMNRAVDRETKSLEPLKSPRRPDGELRLAQMGYSERQINDLIALASAPDGMVLFTGPTGSGKTTSLAEIMRHIARIKPHKRQVTIEDPIEIPMEWAVQLAVTNARKEEDTGAAFTEYMRAALRMDPDIILLGELRGAETAVTAIHAALTGHSVWSTAHTTDPFLVVDRLELMDRDRLNRRVFCDHKILRGVVAQRLVPMLCPECSQPLTEALNTSARHSLEKRMVNAIETWGDLDHVRVIGDGCSTCGGDGIVGRRALAEVVRTDATLMRNFIEHGTEVARREHRSREDTDDSLLSQAMKLVLSGAVDPRQVEDSVDSIVNKGAE